MTSTTVHSATLVSVQITDDVPSNAPILKIVWRDGGAVTDSTLTIFLNDAKDLEAAQGLFEKAQRTTWLGEYTPKDYTDHLDRTWVPEPDTGYTCEGSFCDEGANWECYRNRSDQSAFAIDGEPQWLCDSCMKLYLRNKAC
jgi:hypothetical protein